MSKFLKGFVGLVVGVTAGVITGLLLAPRKGEETRQLIKDRAKKTSERITNEFDETVDRVQDKFRGYKEDAGEKVEELGKKVDELEERVKKAAQSFKKADSKADPKKA
ncbi:MAG: YtxH domain-containing protein [Bacteroidales bacterium]